MSMEESVVPVSGKSSEFAREQFDQIVRAASEAMRQGNFQLAARLYTDAIGLDPANHVLFSNRSVSHLKLNELNKALSDARRCKQLNPSWAKGYHREGVVLQQMGRHADALSSFCTGMAQDPENANLLTALKEAATKSPLKDHFEHTFSQLSKMKLDQNTFIITSIIGQELLKLGLHAQSVTCLEAALRIGTENRRLESSVLSALSSALWLVGKIDRAIAYMQQDLTVAKELDDVPGMCRAFGNLGAAYFSKGSYRMALNYRCMQLTLVKRMKDVRQTINVLSHLGHVNSAVGDYTSALSSHKQCAVLAKKIKDRLLEAREIGNVGAVYLASSDIDQALECHNEHLKIAKQLKNKIEEARAYSNLGSCYHFQRQYNKAITYHEKVLTIATELGDKILEARAYSGLGHAARCSQDYAKAKQYHEKQLDNALQTKEKMAEGRSCSNLGIIYQLIGEYEAALKLHETHLQIAKDLGDMAGQGRAYGNIGIAYSSLGQYELSVKFHKKELVISREVGDRQSESSTQGNLAFAYQALGMREQALQCYDSHLNMARLLKDKVCEARALINIANYRCSMKDFMGALPYYQQHLLLSKELGDPDGQELACHGLGYVYYSLGNYHESIVHYEHDLKLARDSIDKMRLCRAHCNLGLAYRAVGDYKAALSCQNDFLAVAKETGNNAMIFCAFGNIGDNFLKLGSDAEAMKMFEQQLQLAKQASDQTLEAFALGNLGNVCKHIGNLDKALSYHSQELMIFQGLGDVKGEVRSLSCIGNAHMVLGNYSDAYRSYEEQRDRCREIGDLEREAHAFGNMGITKVNVGRHLDAIGLFEQELALLEQLSGHQALAEQRRACRYLGECFVAIGDYKEAIKFYERYLTLSKDSPVDQSRAYRGLAIVYRSVGSLQQSVICFEKCLVVAHDLDDVAAVSQIYGELGSVHGMLGNFDQAINCLQHQLRIARESDDPISEAEALCSLGGVFHQMGEFEEALEYHQKDLEIGTKTGNSAIQCRAHGNIGLSYESLGNYDEAVHQQLKHLNLAVSLNDDMARTLAYNCLGRVYHEMGLYPEAIDSLKQGLTIACSLGDVEDEARIRHRLGLAFWLQGNFERAKYELYRTIELCEMMRRENHSNSTYKMTLFDLQTASYQTLQRVLVALDYHEEALLVAERGRTRAFVDLLLERQDSGSDTWHNKMDSSPVTLDGILATVDQQKCAVIYYSIAAGYLYIWLLLPNRGVVKFHEQEINQSNCENGDVTSLSSFGGASILDVHVGHIRESLGIEPHLSSSRMSIARYDQNSISDEHLMQIGDQLNAEKDSICFLRMTNRTHSWNCSGYSLGSIVSTASMWAKRSASGAGALGSCSSLLSVHKKEHASTSLTSLYNLLIAPLDDVLQSESDDVKELVLVLQGDLYLVPFSLLRPSQAAPCLLDRFNLLVVPSIRAMQANQVISEHAVYNPNCSSAVVVGNPKISPAISATWQWNQLPTSENECKMVAEILGCRPLLGASATKEAVLRDMCRAEVVHFAVNISWKLSAIVLSRSSVVKTPDKANGWDASADPTVSNIDVPLLSDLLLTAADVLANPLNARLVVLDSSHMDEHAGRINSDGVIGLTRAFLATGAQCVLYPLWPVPEQASRLFFKSFYTSLLQGARASQALSDAVSALKSNSQFACPSNWACWTLIGSNVRINSKVALMGHGLVSLLKTPTKSREAMRVVLHLVEKSLQRIQMSQRNAMYVTQQSIENRVGDVDGWQDLLTAMGFRMEPAPSTNTPSVFFPTSDPGDRLSQCSASLQALLGLAVPSLVCLSKITSWPDVGQALISVLRDFLGQTTRSGIGNISLTLGISLWKLQGIHEFLASLGFDLVDVSKDDVTIKAGRSANRRSIQYALQALYAVFETQDTPRVIMCGSSSMDSLVSTNGSVSSPHSYQGSNLSTPSCVGSRKSFFNPAEVDKLPSAVKQNLTPTSVRYRSHGTPDLTLQLTRQTIIRSKYSSPSTSDLSDANHSDDPLRSKVNDSIVAAAANSIVSGSQSTEDSTKFPQTVGNSKPRPKSQIYSTSTSEGEDLKSPDGNLSKLQSCRGAQLGQTQTGAFTSKIHPRRTRARVASQMSKMPRNGGQDCPAGELYDINAGMEEHENLTDSGIHSTSKHTDTATENSTDHVDSIPENTVSRSIAPPNDASPSLKSIDNNKETGLLTLVTRKGLFEKNPCDRENLPQSVFQKVLNETEQCRRAVESMQRRSVERDRELDFEKLSRLDANQTDLKNSANTSFVTPEISKSGFNRVGPQFCAEPKKVDFCTEMTRDILEKDLRNSALNTLEPKLETSSWVRFAEIRPVATEYKLNITPNINQNKHDRFGTAAPISANSNVRNPVKNTIYSQLSTAEANKTSCSVQNELKTEIIKRHHDSAINADLQEHSSIMTGQASLGVDFNSPAYLQKASERLFKSSAVDRSAFTRPSTNSVAGQNFQSHGRQILSKNCTEQPHHGHVQRTEYLEMKQKPSSRRNEVQCTAIVHSENNFVDHSNTDKKFHPTNESKISRPNNDNSFRNIIPTILKTSDIQLRTNAPRRYETRPGESMGLNFFLQKQNHALL